MRSRHHIGKMEFFIKEDSWIAALAARKLGASRVAIVIANTIHLYNAGKEEFLASRRWVAHELEHIRQYRKYGTLRFILLYVTESIKHGYANNRFEREARDAEDRSLFNVQ